MKIKQIASAYGVTVSAVNKWPKSKRDEAIRNLHAGVNPIIAELVGELQRECYVASCHAFPITLDAFFGKELPMFSVYYRRPGENDLTYIAGCTTPLNPYELQGAIVKVKELYKND